MKIRLLILCICWILLSECLAQDTMPVTKASAETKEKNGQECCCKLQYPMESLRNEDQGTVRVAYLIDVDGAVLDSKIVKSSGYRLLDKTAREGLAKCRFYPAKENGVPVKAWMEMTYIWSVSH